MMLSPIPAAVMLLSHAVPVAFARPDDGGGIFTFDPTDVLAYVDVDDGAVRVHYSVEGPNVTLLEDSDGNGVPDYPELVAEEVAAVLDLYEAEGFRRPVTEAALDLGDLGGSDALDVYLVDFGGGSDGQFGVDRCRGGVCAGHLIIENDFAGYGYGSIEEAARVLASHELFHGVQYAYVDDLDVWISEGTATWAEHLYHPETDDYVRLCKYYLAETERSIDRPPAGSVTGFSYGTALFFGFLQDRHGVPLLVDIFDRLPELGGLGGVQATTDALMATGDTLYDAWVDFSTWNLATGRRSGVIESYAYADRLAPGVAIEDEGPTVSDSVRLYPLATLVWRVDHGGGPLFVAVDDEADGSVVLAVHPVVDGSADADVGPAIQQWTPLSGELRDLGDQPPGGYFVLGSHPIAADESSTFQLCVGDEDALLDCAPEDAEPVDDTGSPTPADTADPDDGGAAPIDDASGDKSGCATAGPLPAAGMLGAVGWVVAALSLAARRRL